MVKKNLDLQHVFVVSRKSLVLFFEFMTLCIWLVLPKEMSSPKYNIPKEMSSPRKETSCPGIKIRLP